MHSPKYTIYLFLLFSLVTLLPVNAAKKKYNILFIHSYTEKYSSRQELSNGFKDGLSENTASFSITDKYLNSHHLDLINRDKILEDILDEASKQGTDLIVVANDEAYYSLLNSNNPFLKSVPIVFLRVRFQSEKFAKKYPNSTGISIPPAYEDLLKVAQSIFPERKNVILLSEAGELGEKGRAIFESHWSDFIKSNPEYTLKEFNVTNDPMTSIISEIHLSQDANHSLLFVPYWGLFMPPVTKVSKAPTFTVFLSSLTQGGFGAITANPYIDGQTAAKIALSILSGTPAKSIPVKVGKDETTFDNKQLIFFNVPHKKTPSSSIIINQNYIEKYGTYVAIAVFAIVIFLICIVIRLAKLNHRESRRRIHAQTRLLIQERLVEQRNEFDNVFHSIKDAVVTYDNDLRIHFANNAALESIKPGLTKNSYEGKMAGSFFQLYSNNEEILIQLLKTVGKTGKSQALPEDSYIKINTDKNGFPVSGEVTPIYANGKKTGVVLTYRNISNEALQKRFFNLAVEENSIYPTQYDIETETFIFSPKYVSRIGLNSTRITRTEMNKYLHPEDWEKVRRKFNSAISAKEHSIHLSFRQRNKEGVYEWWEFRITVLHNIATNTPYSVLGIGQSIQHYKETEIALITARDKALEADKVKSSFLANMTHEIRTPLNAIVGFSELLKDISSFNEEEVSHFVETINKNCSILLALINDVLDMSRVEAGTLEFKLSSYDLPVIIQDVYDSQCLNMPQGVELIKEIPDSQLIVNTDPVRLKQVLNNLINNSAKFTSKGSITFGYTYDEANYITFFVKDTGKGMTQDEQDKIFERFYKTDSFTQGVGLGLSICQTIVDRLKGKIWLESFKGIGTTFYVRLPDNL